jgi:hypothetical protein
LPNAIKNHPNGEILPNLVTLLKVVTNMIKHVSVGSVQIRSTKLGWKKPAKILAPKLKSFDKELFDQSV